MTGPRLGARLWWGAIPLVVLLWGTGAVLVSSLPGLPQTGVLAGLASPALAFARDIAVALAAGAAVVGLLQDSPRTRRWALGWGAVGLGLVALSLVALRIDVDGGATGVGLLDVIRESNAGRALAAEALVIVIGLLLLVLGARWARIAAAVALIVATALPVLGGHAGLSGAHSAAGFAIGIHVAAASVWAGGLAVTCALILLDRACGPALLPRFSALALACVIITAEAGLLSASLIAGSLLDLLGTAYGNIVLAKAALLAWLVWLGWQQRRRAIDRLPDASVPATVVTIAGTELVVMGTAIASGVVLARIGPAPIPGNGIASLALVVLGVAIPMLVVAIRPRGWRVSDGLPEAAAVLLLVVIVEVGGVGLLSRLLGWIGIVLEVGLLLVFGWLALSAARVRIGGLVVLAAGLPVVLPLAAVLSDRPGEVRLSVVAALAAEVLLVLAWMAHRRRGADIPVALETVAG